MRNNRFVHVYILLVDVVENVYVGLVVIVAVCTPQNSFIESNNKTSAIFQFLLSLARCITNVICTKTLFLSSLLPFWISRARSLCPTMQNAKFGRTNLFCVHLTVALRVSPKKDLLQCSIFLFDSFRSQLLLALVFLSSFHIFLAWRDDEMTNH